MGKIGIAEEKESFVVFSRNNLKSLSPCTPSMPGQRGITNCKCNHSKWLIWNMIQKIQFETGNSKQQLSWDVDGKKVLRFLYYPMVTPHLSESKIKMFFFKDQNQNVGPEKKVLHF